MVKKLNISNFKSIQEMSLELGRVTVFIGPNGSGKTNILEAVALAGAAAARKLDPEFLASRGIRVPYDARLMRSGFDEADVAKSIRVDLEGVGRDGSPAKFQSEMQTLNGGSFPRWHDITSRDFTQKEMSDLLEQVKSIRNSSDLIEELTMRQGSNLALEQFVVYSPENTALRRYDEESQIRPLGIKGEGLFRYIKLVSDNSRHVREAISPLFKLFDWMAGMHIAYEPPYEGIGVEFMDKFLPPVLQHFDLNSVNEGFLFALFHLLLFASPDTPKFFASDNVETALNPKLCSALIRDLIDLAKTHDKQAILTTHNPSLLDGLNLADPDQALYVIARNTEGRTTARRIVQPREVAGVPRARLSDAFTRGYLGALPQNF